MLIVEASVATPNAGRYVTQLGKHAAAMADGRGHRIRMHGGGNPLAAGEVTLRVDQSPDHTVLTLAPWGRCTATVTDEGFVLRVDAEDEQSLQRIQQVVTRDIERFGRREQIALSWRRLDTPDTLSPPPPPPPPPPPTSRSGRVRVALTATGLGAVLVMLVVHLGLGGAIAAGWAGMGWTAVGGLTVGGLALLLTHLVVPAAAVRLRRHFRRSDPR